MRPSLALALAAATAACSPAGPSRGPSAEASAAPPSPSPTAAPVPDPPDAGAVDAGDPEPAYDLVLAHGRVLDPASGRDGVFDVGIAGGRIARIAPSVDTSRARAVIDATGLLVAPGLVDLHVHVFSGPDKGTYLSRTALAVQADEVAPPSCTTTVVDAGSSGHRTFPVFERETVARSKTRVLAFLNIVGEGMKGGRFEQDLGDMDARATAEAAKAHPDVVVGVKVAHYADPGWEPVDRAVEAARLFGGRVMVDFGEHVPELSLEDLLLRHLRPGDIFTHVYADVRGRTPVVDAAGKVRPYVREAQARGVFFDLGHGGASFVIRQAAPAIAQGFLPDTISTDVHRASLRGSMHDLVAVLSKLHALGMDWTDLIRRTTAAPAGVLGRPALGRLVEGGEADIAVLSVEHGRFSFADVSGAHVESSERLACELTVRAGKVVWDAKGRAPER
jgi:dihydroorotase